MDSQYIEIDPKDKIICVNISSTFDKGERTDNYDRARHYWKVSLSRANKANLVLATVHGIVKAVFKPNDGIKQNQLNIPTLMSLRVRKCSIHRI